MTVRIVNLLPDQARVARAAQRKKISESGRVMASAFMPRKIDEYLSVNWIEFLKCADNEAFSYLSNVYRDKIKSFDGTIVFIPIGLARIRVASATSVDLTFCHLQKKADPSYSGIYGIKDDGAIPTILASCASLAQE